MTHERRDPTAGRVLSLATEHRRNLHAEPHPDCSHCRMAALDWLPDAHDAAARGRDPTPRPEASDTNG